MIAEQKKCRWCFKDEQNQTATIPPNQILKHLLEQRGITRPQQAQDFINPKLSHLHNPALLNDIQKATTRILQAVTEDQPIVIYGDYDVDGVTASAILWHMITAIGADVYTYVPHRIDQGYGLNDQAITQLCQGDLSQTKNHQQTEETPGPSNSPKPLIISVDCGITATAQANIAKAHHVDLIITDHHAYDPKNLPQCFALVHPAINLHQEKKYPYQEICGAGVAFKLAWMIGKNFCGGEKLPKDLQQLLLDLLSLAALGTVADVVPLVDENRVIVKYGLGQIKRTNITGLNALIDAAKLRDEKIDSYHVGFVLGPRLNACGRMGHAGKAIHLLTGADQTQAKKIAEFLTHENDQRRATEKQIVEQAKIKVQTQDPINEQQRAIVLMDPLWHQGVVGIVASRLVDTYHRPAIVLTQKNGIACGSARSVPNVDIHQALNAISHLMISFGGHAMAAGMKIEINKLTEFKQAFIQQINQQLPPDQLVKKIDIDAHIQLNSLTMKIVREIENLAPFGRDNPRPIFAIKNVNAQQIRRIGVNGKHLTLFVKQNNIALKTVGFGMGDLIDQIPLAGIFDIAVEAKINTWQGKTNVELFLKDIRTAEI